MSPRLWPRRRDEPVVPVEPEPVPTPVSHDTMLATAIAEHFGGARVDGAVVHLGFGVTVECHVDSVERHDHLVTAGLFFAISGGILGPAPVFASVTGYGDSPENAVLTGACDWTRRLGVVLRAASTGTPEDRIETFETTIGGRAFRVTSGSLDRALVQDGGDPEERLDRARRRLGGDPWLTPVVLAADVLPVLPSPVSTLLSTFVMENRTDRTVEVKVNGADWEPAARAFPQAVDEPPGGMSLLRELAVLTPLGPATVPSREALDRTLAGLGLRDEPSRVAGWRGWRTHGGMLGAPLTEADVARVEERIGPLDTDHRTFLTTVAGSGAGPGYGLLPPNPVNGVLPLAHAGCGVTWLMQLDAAHRGEVWVDAAGSDRSYRRVAPTFLDWYLGWLDAALRDLSPWLQWNTAACATTDVLSQVLRDLDENPSPGGVADVLGPGDLMLASGDGTPMDPCHGCTTLLSRFGLGDEVFAR